MTAALATRIVDHAALTRNIHRLKPRSGAMLMAVVKADAFGHGCVEVAWTALAAGAGWLGVATVEEALTLRRAGITAPILFWLTDPWVDLAAAIAAEVTISCANIETLQAVAGLGNAMVHLELDTGMARGGSSPAEWAALCGAAAAAEKRGALTVSGLWSHLALATNPAAAAVEAQVVAFEEGVALARDAGLAPSILHLANSAGALEHAPSWLDMVRCGASIYGIETVAGRTHGLEPAIRVVSRVSQLRHVPAGTGVSYNHAYVTAEATTLALVPVGYGDGIPRELSKGGEVVIGGQRHPIVGAISMDQLIVHVGDAPVALGDEVVLLGLPSAGEPDAAEWARITSTISHEILTGLGGRMARTHINNSFHEETAGAS
jgi:alanine racemase